MKEQEYVIGCRVDGGVSGMRYFHVRKEGNLVVFGTRAEAEAEARRLNETMGTTFQHWVEENIYLD